MNDDLHTFIEPELQARIVALVLGEASDFERDELEKIIAEKPELTIYRRRMQAMHDLLGETVKPEPNPEWQLSSGRRELLRQAFATKAEVSTAQRVGESFSTTRIQMRAGVAIAACVMLTVILFFMATPMMLEKSGKADIISYQAAEPESLTSQVGEDFRSSMDLRNEEGGKKNRSPIVSRTYAKDEVADLGNKFNHTYRDVGGVDDPFGGDDDGEVAYDYDLRPNEEGKSSGDQEHSDPFGGAVVNDKEFSPGGATHSRGGRVGYGYTARKNTAVINDREGQGVVGNRYYKTKPTKGRATVTEGSLAGDVLGGLEADLSKRVPHAPSASSDIPASRARSVGTETLRGSDLHQFTSQSEGERLSALKGKKAESKKMRIREYDAFYRHDLSNEVDGLESKEEELFRSEYKSINRRTQGLNEGTKSYSWWFSDENQKAKLGQELDKRRQQLMDEVDQISETVGVDENTNKLNKGLSHVRPVPVAKPKPQFGRASFKNQSKVLPEEKLAADEPFSTFSLNVNDVSFKLARVALLEKGQWPDAAKVRTEEFVNAFDYGDPSPRRGEPVACAIEQAAHPFLQQRNLVRIGMKTAAMGRSQPLRLTVLLDNSGSMEREDREESVRAAMQVLAAQLGAQDVITVVGFARQPRLLAGRVSGDQAHKLAEVVTNVPSEGGTNIEEALRLARKLAKRQHAEGAQSRVVLITDGVANLGNTVPEELSRQVETMRQEGIAFDACGVGAEGLNDDILEALTRKGDGRYYFLNRPEDADAGFAKQLAGALTPAAKNVKVQVVFNPKRVTRYRLLGFEKHRLKKEDFRNDKVDAAEMAAEEAGNAVYQIQVNPQGEGEIGEVFVRFMDAATGRMVERSWSLTYQSQAQPFDLASPSMQLAGTAAMLGEKLHGTDAGSVRFSSITSTLGKIQSHYAADQRVQDLIRMCHKVK